jgi:hypothetical protein
MSSSYEFSETLSIRMTKRDKELLEKIRRARGEDPSDLTPRKKKKKKSWELKGSKSKRTIRIGLFECPICKRKFRAAI